MTEQLIPKIADTQFLYALHQATQKNSSHEINNRRKLSRPQIDLVAETAERLGKKYVQSLLNLTDQQEKVFSTIFANLHDPQPEEDIKDFQFSNEHVHNQVRARVKKTVAALATLAVVGGGGIAGAKAFSNSQEFQKKPSHVTKIEPNVISIPEKRMPQGQIDSQKETITVPITIKRNDTQWGLVEKAIEDAGHQPTINATNVIVDLTTQKNIAAVPNPDELVVGETMQFPNKAMIDRIIDTMENPNKSPLLAKDLHTLNVQPDIPKKALVTKEKEINTCKSLACVILFEYGKCKSTA